MPDRFSTGLYLGDPHTPRYRRRRFVAALTALATFALIWPVYAWFSSPVPFLLGLPLSFAWVILWLLIVFAALLWLYRADHRAPEEP